MYFEEFRTSEEGYAYPNGSHEATGEDTCTFTLVN